MKLPIFLPIILCWFLSGCNPTVDVNVAGNKKTYLIPAYKRPEPKQALTVKLYKTREDYYNDRNIVNTFIIPANTDSLEVELDSNVIYYYDVYADDYTMSNWAVWPYNVNFFKTNLSTGNYLISNNLNNTHRPLLLPGNKSSTWIAVGSFTRAGNTWDTMSAEGRNKSIVFMRNQAAIFTTGSGTREFQFGVSRNSIAKNAFDIKFYDTEDLNLIDPQIRQPYMTGTGPVSTEYNKLNPYSQNLNVILPVTDTFYLNSDALRHTFIMVRVK